MAYICDTYSHYVLEGNDYNIDTQIIQINFNYGFSFKSNRLCHIYKIKDQDNNLLVKNFTVYEIDMDKYKSLWYNKNIKEIEKNKYIIMLDLNPEELKSLSNKDRMVNKYMSELKRINENPKLALKKFYNARLSYLKSLKNWNKFKNGWAKRLNKLIE